MTEQEFEATRWHKDMFAHIDVHTITMGVVRMAAKVVEVNFATGRITLTDGKRNFHRQYNEIELLEEV